MPLQTFIQENLWSIVLVTVLWVLPWKAWALWRAAQRGDRWWFIAIFLINSLAILEIFYIFVFSKRREMKA